MNITSSQVRILQQYCNLGRTELDNLGLSLQSLKYVVEHGRTTTKTLLKLEETIGFPVSDSQAMEMAKYTKIKKPKLVTTADRIGRLNDIKGLVALLDESRASMEEIKDCFASFFNTYNK